ncbi:transmembrane protein, putative (macronuclear) [Tetrahymena thermophila SB210]|uniref:Transmembrane protein, putative n=1 Tax=Tetrahymena thermophila (strain SB210) TaxID=312017 RepID=W7X7Y9_TETTS|nr:transmembrane protein, putative [Tetrahymena thermophila SB210]EWS72538.1 transmembrane protein, putative [Tetrahymena thermophila SB210]|eukprot:XP_012654918.1 transmembrane protein, putative [Tetrahymena thermophila SB210]
MRSISKILIINNKSKKFKILKKENKKKIGKMKLKNAILILLFFVLLICSNLSTQVEAKSLKSQTQTAIKDCLGPKQHCGNDKQCCRGLCVMNMCLG